MPRSNLMRLVIDNKAAPRSFTVTAQASGATRIDLYDVIDDYYGVSASAFVSALNSIKEGDIELHVNSPGGDVFAARAMVAAIAAHPSNITAHIDGLAASAASYVALACDKVVMQEGAMMMIHCASCIVWGTSPDMIEMAGLLDKIDASIIADYERKTGKTSDELMTMMRAETWMTSEESVSEGFADEVVTNPKGKAKNTWNLAAFGNAPAALLRNESDDTADLSEQEKKFLQDMIPHHEMAIEMARAILPNAASEKVRGLAEAIIAAQAGEIALIETWLADTAAPENKKKPMKPMKMQTDDPATKQNEEPAAAGFFMAAANANRLRLAQIV